MGPFHSSWTEADVETVIERGIPEELLYVPIVVGMNAADCEQEWAESICLKLAEHPHFNVRGNAVLGLSHIARKRRCLDLSRAAPVILNALADEHDFVRGHAGDVVQELKIFLDKRAVEQALKAVTPNPSFKRTPDGAA